MHASDHRFDQVCLYVTRLHDIPSEWIVRRPAEGLESPDPGLRVALVSLPSLPVVGE